MSKCENCRLRKESAKAFDIHWLGEDDCPYDKCQVPDFPKTNADRIRSMSDEELARLFADENCGYCRIHDFCFAKGCQIDCEDMWLDWLKGGAKE